MNRICAAFDDIGNINLRNAEVAPFNWQMLLSGPCESINIDACELFCEMDDINTSNIIESQDMDYITEREAKAGYDLLAQMIIEELDEKYGSYETVYPSLVKYLFTNPNFDKASHKQMFWRIFGDVALKNLKHNLAHCRICEDCSMKIPDWAEKHICASGSKGFFECVECHKVFPRIGVRQCRCQNCQAVIQQSLKKDRNKRYHDKKKLEKELANKLQLERLKRKG